MRLLLTSDTQTELSNLDLCEIVLQEVINAATLYNVDAILHCGDAKEHYDPVHLMVVKFWVRFVREVKAAGFDFYINLGNHDRVSQSADSKNWLDILRAAGAVAISRPSTKQIGDGFVSFLPFTPDRKQEIKWATELASATRRGKAPTALIFHTEVYGEKIGGTTSRGITPEELRADAYDICLGGHIHEHHNVCANVWRVGSPFCQDWSEANQRKGLVYYDSVTKKVTQLPTKIPGWYDASFLREHNITPERNAYIRSKIQVTSKKISEKLRAAEEKLAKRYPDARLFVVPKVEAAEKLEVDLSGSTDKEKVEQYVAATLQDGVKFKMKAVTAYLTSKLLKIDPGARGSLLRFVDLACTNVLTFKKLHIKYANQGLVLLRGVNLDRPKRSNGAGKTNVLSLPKIALFGESGKGQKNDEWARERTQRPAMIEFRLKDERKRLIEVKRGRRKHRIECWVNNRDASHGLTGKRRQETQGHIERITGFDMQMFENSVYIDQTIANGFVFGTQKNRMDLIGKLQRLERFEAAQKLVAKDIKDAHKDEESVRNELEVLEQSIRELEDDLAETNKARTEDNALAVRLKKARKTVNGLKEEKSALIASAEFYTQKQQEADDLQAESTQLVSAITKATGDVKYWAKRATKTELLIQAGKCPTCEQLTDGITARVDHARKHQSQVHKLLSRLKKAFVAKQKKIDSLAKSIRHYENEVQRVNADLNAAKYALQSLQEAVDAESGRIKKTIEKSKSIKEQLRTKRRIFQACQDRLKELEIDLEMLYYAEKAFKRNGMPLYLAASLCPLLNNAAEEYSEIFTDGKIKIRFEVVDGEFMVNIVNPSGSETEKGQSVGESAEAGIIAAFALREAAPKTNLLILDEPGHGLDPEGARKFARGLLKLKERFETILVTTHSPIIEGILAGEKVWTVTKENGISRLTT